jgi:hypothetical protein
MSDDVPEHAHADERDVPRFSVGHGGHTLDGWQGRGYEPDRRPAMSTFHIIPDATDEIAIKRFNLPVTAVDTCPHCGAECRTRFDGDDYVRYPKIGVPTPIWIFCNVCCRDWQRHVVIQFSVTAFDGVVSGGEE